MLTALRVLNADSKLNCSHLLMPSRTVQRHHSAQIRSGDSSRYINLVVVVPVVVVVVVVAAAAAAAAAVVVIILTV